MRNDLSKKRFLFVNPWVHDFAHFNLWSVPLGLYRVVEYFSQFDCEIFFVDTQDEHTKEKENGTSHIKRTRIQKPDVYKKIPRFFSRYGISEAAFAEKIKKTLPVDAIFITSQMSYWYTGIEATIELLKKILPSTPIILGGIYATLYKDHAKTLGCDRVYAGEINDDILETLKELEISLKKTGAKKHWSEYIAPKIFAPIKTSSGCPFRCTYCATPILNPQFVQSQKEVVLDEIELFYKKGIRNFAIYDDALLYNAQTHIIPILKCVSERYSDVSFFTPVGLHSRMISEEMAAALKRANFQYIRIGYETKNIARQKETGGKILDPDLISGIDNLVKAGFDRKDIGVFVMFGLPDQPFDEVRESVEFLKTLGVKIALTEFSPVKGTKEALKVPPDIIDEPLYTNNTVYSYLFGKYDWNDVLKLKNSIKDYNSKT